LPKNLEVGSTIGGKKWFANDIDVENRSEQGQFLLFAYYIFDVLLSFNSIKVL